MGELVRLRIKTDRITKEEWRRFWRMRQHLSQKLALRRRQVEILEQAELEWERWGDEMFARLAAGAGIEDEGKIA